MDKNNQRLKQQISDDIRKYLLMCSITIYLLAINVLTPLKAQAETCSFGNDSALFESTATGYDLSLINSTNKEGTRFTLPPSAGPYTITRLVAHGLTDGGGNITASLYNNSSDSQTFTTQIPGTSKTIPSGETSFVLDNPYSISGGTYWFVLETNGGSYLHNLGRYPGGRTVYVTSPNGIDDISSTVTIYGCGHNFNVIPCRNGETGTCRQTVDASQTNVQIAIDSSSENDGVYIPADSKTWDNGVILRNKKIKIFGAGIDQTNITIPTGGLGFDTFCTPSTPFRISGISFFGDNSYPGQAAIQIQAGNGTCKRIEIDNNRFHNIGNASIFIYAASHPGQGDVYGVIHNNLFDGTHVTGFGIQNYQSSDAETPSIGTDNAMFIEGNTFTFDNMGKAITDAAGGGRIVFRFNTVVNAWAATHGAHHDSAYGSTIFYELYNNDFTIYNASQGWGSYGNQGGGEEIHFNNVVTTDAGDTYGGFNTQFYRSCCWSGFDPLYPCGTVNDLNSPSIDAQHGRCNGFNSFDGNWLSNGYPCWGNPGRTLRTRQAFSPIYHWNNRYKNTGTKMDMYIGMVCSGAGNYPEPADHVKANRDFYNSVGGFQASPTNPFDGTTGMGFGLLSNRPTTCLSGGDVIGGLQTYSGQGVGYYATDQKTLYRCSSHNTWTVQYRPYTCPHPAATGVTGTCDYSMAGTGGYGASGPTPDTTPPAAPSGLGVN